MVEIKCTSTVEFAPHRARKGRCEMGHRCNRERSSAVAEQAEKIEARRSIRGPERFFYDRSTYTGAHWGKAGPREEDLHEVAVRLGRKNSTRKSVNEARNAKGVARVLSHRRRPSEDTHGPGVQGFVSENRYAAPSDTARKWK